MDFITLRILSSSIHGGSGVRRSIQVVIGLLLFGLILPASTLAAEKTIRIALLAQEDDSSFWRAVHAGALKAQKELSNERTEIVIVWLAPKVPRDLDQQASLFGTAIGLKVDAILVSPLHPRILIPNVEIALRQKIPVMALETILDYPLITSSLSTNNYTCGAQAAVLAGRLTGAKGPFLVMRSQQFNKPTERREFGFFDGLRNVYEGIAVMAPDEYAGVTDDSAYRLSQKLIKTYAERATCVYTSDMVSTRAMMRALSEGGLRGKIKQIGYLEAPEAAAAIRAGTLAGAVCPDPFYLGYRGIKMSVDAVYGKMVLPREDSPVCTVSTDSLSDPALQEFINPPVDEFLKPKTP